MNQRFSWLVGGAITALMVIAVGCAPADPFTPAAAEPLVTPSLTPAPDVEGDPDEGRRLFRAAGCIACHTVRSIPDATGLAGPVLDNISLRPTIAGNEIPNTPEMMVEWLLDPEALKPGTLMPDMGLSEEEARDLAAFLYSLPYNPEH